MSGAKSGDIKLVDGKGKQKCKKCGCRSVAGLRHGEGLCPYHYCERMWGKNWADKVYKG